MFYQIIPAKEFRNTKDVQFHILPVLEGLSSIDRVAHTANAISPGSINNIKKPWYMHPHQEDNLIVFQGHRTVNLYTVEHGKVETFEAYPDKIIKDGKVIFEGPAILHWDINVFHQIKSGEAGSMSLNFAIHKKGFDLKTNFNIYNLDFFAGKFKTIREGYLDQKKV